METRNLKVIVMMLVMFLIGGTVLAQAGKGPMMNIPGLTDDQKTQIQKLRLDHLKEMQGLRNQVAENRAHYHTLMTADKPDMNAINKNIDEYVTMRSTMMKKQAAHIQDIRKLLTDEQRLFFDNHLDKRGMAFYNGRGYGARGPANGMRRGMGYFHSDQKGTE